MSRRVALLVTFVLTPQLGCWAAHARFDETGSDGCARPSGVVSPLTEHVSPGRCVLEGRDELGVAWRSVCDGTSCTLAREDETGCTCTDMNLSSRCANGVPTCTHWDYFDYTNVEIVREP